MTQTIPIVDDSHVACNLTKRLVSEVAPTARRRREAGFFAYMTKPINIPAFLGTLAKAVGVND